MRHLFLFLLIFPCSLDASLLSQQEMDEWLYLVSFGAPGTLKSDRAAGIFGPDDLVVKRKKSKGQL